MRLISLLIFIGLTSVVWDGKVFAEPLSPSEPLDHANITEGWVYPQVQQNELPDTLFSAFCKALEYYPELWNTSITFKSKKIKTSLNVRPKVWSVLFRKKENRKYVVRVNNDPKRVGENIINAPYAAQVGVFGHELAHVVDYDSLSVSGVFGRGIGYMKKDYRIAYENKVDKHTIQVGLGWYLQSWASYILENPYISEDYKAYKSKYYLDDNHIDRSIARYTMGKRLQRRTKVEDFFRNDKDELRVERSLKF